MNAITQTVLDRYQVRKSKRQRAEFRDYLREVSHDLGYVSHEEQGSLGACNVIVGDPATARVVYTAHYDTCAAMPVPNFITPTCVGIYLLYQLLLVVGMFLCAGVPTGLCTLICTWLHAPLYVTYALSSSVFSLSLISLCLLLVCGPANRHTANDNTSGVCTLLEIMAALPRESRGEVAFIFFDLEEVGMIGSSFYASTHRADMKDKLLINFDCVSDGKTILMAVRKKAARYTDALKAAFPDSDAFEVKVLTKGVLYPSDQAVFPLGVGVAATKKTRRGLLYLDRIHTNRDTVFEEENIAFLTAGALRLLRELPPPSETL